MRWLGEFFWPLVLHSGHKVSSKMGVLTQCMILHWRWSLQYQRRRVGDALTYPWQFPFQQAILPSDSPVFLHSYSLPSYRMWNGATRTCLYRIGVIPQVRPLACLLFSPRRIAWPEKYCLTEPTRIWWCNAFL